MATPATLHVTPIEDGAWAVKPGEGASASAVYRTRAEAVAGALEALEYRAEAEVLIHGLDGGIGSILTIRQVVPPMEVLQNSDLEDLDDPAARAEALRITPSYARIKAGIGKHPKPSGNFDDEEMAY